MRNLLIFFLLLFAARESFAVNLTAPPEILPAGKDSATLRWKLDRPAGGRVRYGLSADKLDLSAADEVGTEHALTLRGLRPDTRYFYSIGTAKYPLTTGSFLAGGGVPAAKNDPSAQAVAPAPPRKVPLLQKITGLISKPAPQPAPALKPATMPPVSANAIGREVPPTRRIWGSLASLPDHFARHGADFGAKSPDDYAAQAWRFRERAVAERLPMKLDTDGTVRVFDPQTRAFAAFNRDGTAKTFFRPESASYWQRQPGRALQTPPWISP